MTVKKKKSKALNIILAIILVIALLAIAGYIYFFRGSYSGADKINLEIQEKNDDNKKIEDIVAIDEKHIDDLDYVFIVDGEEYSKEDLRDRQKNELLQTNKLLNRRFKQDIKVSRDMPFEEIKGIVTAQKFDIGQDNLKAGLKRQTDLGEIISKIASSLSGGKRKVSVADIYLKNSKYDAKEVMKRFEEMMTINNMDNQLMNFKANPNHFYSHGDETTQEVVEMTGGSRIANRFFLKYGDTEGLTTKKDPNFIAESAGYGFLVDGTQIGGVRHEMADEDGTLHARLQVEFPSTMPDFMIHQHAIHLLVEFSNRLTDIETK